MNKVKKTKKSTRYHGRGRGTCGWGARKAHRSSGNKGGKGMSGTGKRADHKKTLVQKLYGNNYFGKQGITSRKTQKTKEESINIRTIQENIENYLKNGKGKQSKDKIEINLEKYKILGEINENLKIKGLVIRAKSASKSALENIKKIRGEIIVKKKENIKEVKREKEVAEESEAKTPKKVKKDKK